MEPETCSASAGTAWLGEGWRLFTASPGMWIVMAIVLFLVFMALGFVPVIGMFASQMLAPALSGGMLLAARDAEAGRPLDLGRLFEPLVSNERRGDIIILGLLYLGASLATLMFAAIVAAIAVGASAITPHLMTAQGTIDPAVMASMGIGALFAVMVWLLLAMVVAALFFYAIPLVALAGAPPIQALGDGLRGLLRNWLPLLVLGLVWTGLAILATIPLMLGWLVLGPVTCTAWYASYRDIFEPGEGPGHAAGPSATAIDA